MKLSDLPRDETGWIFLPCGALIVDADEDVQAEHVPYCATCAGQIDHESDDSPCDHDSCTGDEGPISELGRWPVRWRCDGCGAIQYDDQERSDSGATP